MATTELGIRLTVDGASQAAGAINGVGKSLDGLGGAASGASGAINGAGKSLSGLGGSAGSASAGLKQAAADLGKMEMSAKATAAALRNVPAQFTDIAVGLASGQAPLTVLLQQGGQLKDMFGGVGNAAKALGGYMASLITPFSAAAAAVGTLGYAYYAGSKEADAYNKTLILTGNAIGLTTGQLQGMAQSMASVSGTQSKAAEVLNQFVAAGDVGANSLQKLSQAAIAFEKTTGTAIEDTVKQFSKLGDKPLEASIKLNESTNFLTLSLYQQIKALEEQGKFSQAAAVAQNAYADTMNQSAAQITANLGSIERGWIGILDKAGKVADFLKGIGRPDSPDQIEAQLRTKIINAENNLRYATEASFGGAGSAKARQYAAELQELKDLQAATVKTNALAQIRASDRATEAQGLKNLAKFEQENQTELGKIQKQRFKLEEDYQDLRARGLANDEVTLKYQAKSAELTSKQAEYLKKGQEKPGSGDSASKLQLEQTISDFERAQKASEEYFKNQEEDAKSAYDRGLMDYEQYVKRKEAISLASNEYGTQIASGELSAVQRSGIAQKDKISQENKYLAELEGLAAKRANISQKAANDIQEAEDKAAKAAAKASDAQNQKMKESVDEYIAESARKKAADQELQAARAAMEGKPAEVIAGIEAGMAVRAQAAKQLDDMRKAYAKAAEEAQNYADGIEMIKEHGGIVSPSEQKELERLVKNVRAAGTELGRLGDAVDTNEIDAKARASAASIKAQTDKLAGEINTKLADAILSAGVDGGAGLRKAIEDILITKPFRIAVEALVAPISQDIARAIIGSGGGGIGGIGGGIASAFGLGAQAGYGALMQGGVVEAIKGGITAIGTWTASSIAAGFGTLAGTLGPIAAGVSAANALFNAMQGSVKEAGTFVYGYDTAQGFRSGGRQDFVQTGGIGGGGTTRNSSWFDPDKAIADYMAAANDSLKRNVKGWAETVGLSADAIGSYSQQIEVSIGGLDAAGVTTAIDKAMAGFGESFTQATYGLSAETLKTLASNLQGVNAVFESVGMTALDASVESAKLATSIVDTAGGLDNLGKLTSAMYAAITTPAQKAADEAAKLDKAFAALGVSTPKTVQDLAKLAQAQDLTSDAGRKAAVGILSLLPALQQVQDGAKATRDAMLKDVGVEQGDISAIVKKGLIEGNLKDAGGQISDVVMTGIQNALYGKMADAITGSFTNEMLAPLLDAMQKGKSLPEALAAVDWTQVKSKFQQTVDDISAIFNNTQVTSGIGALKGAIQDIFSTASYSIPKGWILTKDDATKAATGGLITGPGTGTSDSIPAMLSNGEFVVNAKSAAKLGTGFLNAINAGEMPTTVNRASGGMVWDDPAEYQDWLALSGAGNTSTTANSGYYENGFVADSRNAPGATKAAADYAALDTDAAQTYIDVLRAMGEVYSANTLALENATEGFDALHVAMYREIEAGKTLVSMRETLAQSEKGAAQLGVDLLTAQGDTTGAASAQRTLDLLDVTAQRTAAASRLLDEGLSENEKSYQTAIVATADATIASYDLTKAREAEITAIETVKSALDEGKDTFAQFDIDISRQLGLDALADDLQKASDMKDVIKAVADAQNKLDTIGDSLSDADKAAQKYIVTTGTMALKEYDLNKARQVALDGLTLTKGKLEDLGNADISLGIAKANATGDTQTAYGLQKALDLADVTKAVNAAQTQLDKYGDTLDATAKAALQTTITNGKLISSQYDLNKARDGEITALQRLKSAAATYDTTTVSWLRAKGDDKGADAAQRGIDLKDVLDSTALATARLADATDIGEITTLKATIATNAQTESLYDLNKERQKETELLNEIKNRQESAAETGRTTYIEMLKATGQSAKAAALELEKATEGFDAAHIAIVRQTNANKALIQSAKGLESTGDSVTASRIGLLTAQGDKTGAAALQRELDIRPYVTAIADATRDLGTATTDTEKGILNTVIANNKQSISNYDLAKSLDAEAEAASAAQEAANALAQSYEDLKNQIAQANIDLAKASGLDSYAEDLQAALDLRDHAGDAYYESLYRELQTIRKLTDARQQLNTLEDATLKNQISLKRAQGEGILANALERSAFLKNASLPAAQAKAELDRSNVSFASLLQSRGLAITGNDSFGLAGLSGSLSPEDRRIKSAYYDTQTGTPGDQLNMLLREFASLGRTDSQKASLQSVVDTSADIVKAYDRNKALEAELKIIELQDEAYKQNLDAQKALADAQKSYADVLKSTIETMRDFISTLDGAASPTQNLASARLNFQTIAGKAASGDTSAYKDLTPVARTFLDLSKNYSKTLVDYQRDEAKVRTTLNAVITANQRELDKLPQEIAKAADPTKDAWLKLQEATAKEAETSVMLTALGVDKAASTRRLRTAEESLSDRYLEAVYALDEAKKTPLLKAFNDAIAAKADSAELPEYTAFNLGDIWGTKIADVLPATRMTNEDWNALIATKFPGLVPSDFLTKLTPDDMTNLVRGVMPEPLTVDNIISSTADVSGLVNAKIGEILPAGFAGESFDAKQMMQDAINRAMAAIPPARPVAPDLTTKVVNKVQEQGLSGGSSGTAYSWAGMSKSDIERTLSLSPNTAHSTDYVASVYATLVKDNAAQDWLDKYRSYLHYKNVPGFAVGTNYVPQDMFAQIHEGEAIIPAPFNPERYSKASGNDALVAEIKALRAEVESLRKSNEAGQNAIAANTGKTARVLAKFDIDGLPETRT